MHKFVRFVGIMAIIALIISTMLFFVGYFNPRQAGIFVDSTPGASVYLDGILVGKTPFETNTKPKDVIIKIIPNDIDGNVFETKVSLSPGIKTIVKRDFGLTEAQSGGEIVSFEKIGGNAALAVISIPDGVSLTIDGKEIGVTPYQNTSIQASEHKISLGREGYIYRSFSVNTYAGYKLTAVVQLAQTSNDQNASTTSSTPVPKIYQIEILPTPNGFLRVRSEANVSSQELSRLKTGDKFNLISEDTAHGWYQIEYEPANATESAKIGWIAKGFGKKIEVQ